MVRTWVFISILLTLTIYVLFQIVKQEQEKPQQRNRTLIVRELMQQAVTEEDVGNLDAAVKTYREIIDIDPAYAPAYNNLANLLHQRGFEDAAIVNYKKAIELDSTLVSARYNLALSFYNKGFYQEAIREWEKVLQLKPDSLVAAQTAINISIAKSKEKYNFNY